MEEKVDQVITPGFILGPGIIEAVQSQDCRPVHSVVRIFGEHLGASKETGQVVQVTDMRIAHNGVAVIVVEAVIQAIQMDEEDGKQ